MECIVITTYHLLTIPEQTNLAGQVRTEINCLPVINQDLEQFFIREDKRMEQQKPKIARWESTMDNKSRVVIPGNAASSTQFSNLIVSVFKSLVTRGSG